MKEYQATDTMRNQAIKKKRASGKTLESIGLDYGLSRERIRQICKPLDKKKKGAYTDYKMRLMTS